MGSECLKSYFWNSTHIETVAVASCYKGLQRYADAALVFCGYVPLLHFAQSGTMLEQNMVKVDIHIKYCPVVTTEATN